MIAVLSVGPTAKEIANCAETSVPIGECEIPDCLLQPLWHVPLHRILFHGPLIAELFAINRVEMTEAVAFMCPHGALWIPGCSETDDPVVLQVASDLWIHNPDESSQC